MEGNSQWGISSLFLTHWYSGNDWTHWNDPLDPHIWISGRGGRLAHQNVWYAVAPQLSKFNDYMSINVNWGIRKFMS